MDRNVPVPMRDGTILRADVYRPDDDRKYPSILMRTAYNKQLMSSGEFLNFVEAAHQGYAVILQDIRGRFASEGEWDRLRMFEVEGPDGYDTVEWIAEQSWCDGNVGMAGGSYLAAMTWITAMESPPHLKAISPWIGDIGTNMQPPPYSGTVNLYTAASAIPLTSLDYLKKLADQGEDVSEMIDYITKVLYDPDEVIHSLPLKDIPLAKYEPIKEMWQSRLNPVPIETQEARKRYEKIKVPTFHIGGWFDQLEWAVFENFQNMKKRGGSPQAREGQYLQIGPWMHGSPLGFMGEMGFGSVSGGGGLDIHQRIIDFFNKYLKGMDVDIPKIRYFVLGRNEWRESGEWPLPHTDWQRYYLHSNGNANTLTGDGWLCRREPADEPEDTFIYDPLNPVRTIGGKVVPAPGLAPGPFDQSSIERRDDVLCYTTQVLKEDLEVTGPIRLHLFAASTAVDTDFTAKLVDVYPDGRALNLVDGIQRASYRECDKGIKPIQPSKVYEYVITLGNISNVFRKGHRIRLEVSSSNFPLYDRNMNTGNPVGEDAVGVKARQTVYHRSGYASYMDLPIIP